MVVPAEAASVPHAREAVAAHFNGGSRDPVGYVAALLCVSELVANVVVHAYPDAPGEVEVRVWGWGDRVVLSVTDHGVGFPEQNTCGLGLQIVEALSESVEYQRLDDGANRVTAWIAI